jgi:hypothetical protein
MNNFDRYNQLFESIGESIGDVFNQLNRHHPVSDYGNGMSHTEDIEGLYSEIFNNISVDVSLDIDISIIYNDEPTKPKTLSKETLNSFPKGYSDKPCSICMETNNESVKLPCGHCFHEGCISKWLLERSVYCPMCKYDCTI